jgi:hypothetical protein
MSNRETSPGWCRRVIAAPEQCFPLQRRCSLQGADDQEAFAREASSILSPGETASLEVTSSGLLLLAQNQVAHARLMGLVQAVYGRRAEFGPLEIRYREKDGVREEPHMSLRVDCRADRCDAVLADLGWREAHVLDQCRERARAVVRATAPLALLLGYPLLLVRIDASASVASWLAFYARVGAWGSGAGA